MKEFRVTFHNGPTSDCLENIDLTAENTDEAFAKAYRLPQAKRYTECSIMEKPTESSVIGVEFSYYDTVIKKNFTGFVFIKAESEGAARLFYIRNLKDKRFWFDAGKPAEDGKCIYGYVKRTYFACCPGYDFEVK